MSGWFLLCWRGAFHCKSRVSTVSAVMASTRGSHGQVRRSSGPTSQKRQTSSRRLPPPTHTPYRCSTAARRPSAAPSACPSSGPAQPSPQHPQKASNIRVQKQSHAQACLPHCLHCLAASWCAACACTGVAREPGSCEGGATTATGGRFHGALDVPDCTDEARSDPTCTASESASVPAARGRGRGAARSQQQHVTSAVTSTPTALPRPHAADEAQTGRARWRVGLAAAEDGAHLPCWPWPR